MSATGLSGFVDQLADNVRDYRYRNFRLAKDLRGLEQIHGLDVPDGVAFYCNRILEALTRAGVVQLNFPETNTLFAALGVLQESEMIPKIILGWSHEIRFMGNHARHLGRELCAEDTRLGLLLLERFLTWFFCDFEMGPKAKSIARTGDLQLTDDHAVRQLLCALERRDIDIAPIQRWIAEPDAKTLLSYTPVFHGALAEGLMERGCMNDAQHLLEEGRKTFPDDERLCQLMGLYWSRTGNLERARSCLMELRPLENNYADPETIGILAGIIKRFWKKDPNNRSLLHEAHNIYARGWRNSDRTNTYLGINAATTALWLNRPNIARSIANEVNTYLEKRLAVLHSLPATKKRCLGYWDQATRAEALLLMEQWDAAKTAYRDAFQEFAHLPKNIEVTRQQMIRILDHLGRADEAESFA
jgi:hypothetical protein